MLYKDSTQNTTNLTYTRKNPNDLNASVNLNGNTIKKVFADGTPLVENTHYTVSGGNIKLLNSFLNTLTIAPGKKSREITMSVDYNASGINVADPKGELPNKTEFLLTIQRAKQSALNFSGLNDNYVYGIDPFNLVAIGGSSGGTVEYTSSNPDIAEVNGGQLNIKKPGMVEIKAILEANSDYEEVSVAKTINITPKVVTVTGLGAENRDYNGLTETKITGTATLSGEKPGDDVLVTTKNAKANFVDKNVGNAKKVNFTGVALTGNKSDCYKLADQPVSVFANVTPKPVNVTKLYSASKQYDGKDKAEITGGEVNGKITGDDLTVVAEGKFPDSIVGDNKVVSIIGSIAFGGADAGNYVRVGEVPSAPRANITKRQVTIAAITANDKDYDGNDSVVLNDTYSYVDNVLSMDTLNIVKGEAKFVDKNVGESKQIVFTGYNVDGANVSNYELKEQPTGIVANIFKKNISIDGLTAKDKEYDGGITTDPNGDPLIVDKASGDDLEVVTGLGYFADKKVETAKPVTFNGFNVSGNDAKNYNLIGQPAPTTANIFAKNITANVAVRNKVFDGTNVATFKYTPSLTGAVENDDVVLNYGVPTFSSVDIGNDIVIDFDAPFTISGADAINYNLEPVGEIKANIEEPADTTELKAAIDRAQGLDQNNYTEASWTAMNVKLTIAIDYLDDTHLLQEDADTATADLNGAIDALVEITGLSNRIDEIQAEIDGGTLVETKYTISTWNAFKEALDSAKLDLANPAATAEEIDGALKALNDTRDALTERKTITFEAKDGGNLSNFKIGDTITLVTSDGYIPTDTSRFTWDSEFVTLTVNSPAQIKALKAGNTSITYTNDEGETGTLALNILDNAPPTTETTTPTTNTTTPTTNNNQGGGTTNAGGGTGTTAAGGGTGTTAAGGGNTVASNVKSGGSITGDNILLIVVLAGMALSGIAVAGLVVVLRKKKFD